MEGPLGADVQSLGRVVGGDVRYMNMGSANGMMFFQCKDLELLRGVHWTHESGSCKRTVGIWDVIIPHTPRYHSPSG